MGIVFRTKTPGNLENGFRVFKILKEFIHAFNGYRVL